MDASSVSQDQAKPEDQPKPQEPTPTPRGGGTWLLWLFMTPVFYLLSMGPVAKIEQALHRHGKAPSALDRTFKIIYRPIMWSAEHCRPFGNAMGWYLFSLWKLDD